MIDVKEHTVLYCMLYSQCCPVLSSTSLLVHPLNTLIINPMSILKINFFISTPYIFYDFKYNIQTMESMCSTLQIHIM
jgi:hypothetical protein